MLNLALNLIPLTLSICQMIEIIIVYWKTKNLAELKLKYKDLGFQVGTIIATTIDFRPNRNRLPTFGEQDYLELLELTELII